mmetsp:Transcript_5610/g.15704  ORF Transcript_5610/g.15704 Transcript_5610/m.15704 type:complete len:294 (-) Transcript_5610:1114-1995(-)
MLANRRGCSRAGELNYPGWVCKPPRVCPSQLWPSAPATGPQNVRRRHAKGRPCVVVLDTSSFQSAALFCFGLGYTGRAITSMLQREGWAVSGTCQTPEEAAALAAKGIRCHVFDPTSGHGLSSLSGLEELEGASYVLHAIPPLESLQTDVMLLALRGKMEGIAASGNLRWFGYLSTTGVYGDWGGQWVDESTSPRPPSPKMELRYAVERELQQFGRDSGVPLHVFRLGGIYGPGRSALDTLQKGRTRELSSLQRRREGRRYTMRCHVADVCQALQASMALQSPASHGDVRAFT